MSAFDRPSKEDRKKIMEALGVKPKKKSNGFGKIVCNKTNQVLFEGKYPLLAHIKKTKFAGYDVIIKKL